MFASILILVEFFMVTFFLGPNCQHWTQNKTSFNQGFYFPWAFIESFYDFQCGTFPLSCRDSAGTKQSIYSELTMVCLIYKYITSEFRCWCFNFEIRLYSLRYYAWTSWSSGKYLGVTGPWVISEEMLGVCKPSIPHVTLVFWDNA